MTEEERLLSAGTIFAGDYRIVRPLAEGGMGAVYVVEQLSTGSQRALKVIREELLKDAKTRERFQQECRVSARIQSDHVVQVLAAGVDPTSQLPFMVMELLQGETLLQQVQMNGPVDVVSAMELFEQLCHALGAAHSLGVIHRDLKPENVFLAKSRRARAGTMVKVLDFGVAKVLAESRTSATSAIGTPSWMAPEQTEIRTVVSPATDLWAVGLLAFYALTGKYYWRACNDDHANVTALMRELLFEPLPLATTRASEYGVQQLLPQRFNEFFARCVTRRPADRFQTAAEAETALLASLETNPASVAFQRTTTVTDGMPPLEGPGLTVLGERVGQATGPSFEGDRLSLDGAAPKGATVLSTSGPPMVVAAARPVPRQVAAQPAYVARPAVQPPRSVPRPKKTHPGVYAAVGAGALVALFGVIKLAGGSNGEGKDEGSAEEDARIPLPGKSSSKKPSPSATGTTTAPREAARVACSHEPARIFFADDFRDSELAWKLDPPWEIGAARISKGASSGLPDPKEDHYGTVGGMIAGASIGGNYRPVAGVKALTTPAMDTSDATRIVLQYYRWLNCDDPRFAPHSVEVSRDDGVTWANVWKSNTTVIERAWSLQLHDLSKYASSRMRVRFAYQVIDASSYSASGWNLDDVVVASSECF